MPYRIRPLDASTWDAFAELVERNNGIFGGCWCLGYHPEFGQQGISPRAVKEERVRTGRAHAALVLDEDGTAQGWCQYGSPEELPGIKHKREYEKDPPPPPEWRITCLYVDKKHRGQGIARAALEGALDQIAHAGGGLVEACAELTQARLRQQEKDSWANRAAVAECHARIDVVLDLFLETQRAGRPAGTGLHKSSAWEKISGAR
jgi:ribosomal protein S18 acetylase RimI-like enzyme